MNKVADIRKQRGESQEALAERIDIPRTHLSAIESGRLRPRIDTCQKIAAALGVTVDEAFPSAPGAESE